MSWDEVASYSTNKSQKRKAFDMNNEDGTLKNEIDHEIQ